MKYRILDENDDYSFGRGQQNLTYGIFAVSQAIKTRLKFLKGEWWENTDEGLPLFQQILGQPGTNENILIADNLVKERILDTQNVTSIESFKSNYSNRSYSFSCTVNTKYGRVDISNDL